MMIRQFVFCEIEQTGITEKGAPRPKRAFLRACKEKFLEIFGQVNNYVTLLISEQFSES